MGRGERAAGGGQEHLAWRVLVDDARPGAANMARDHALAACPGAGGGTLRFYRWEPAALSLGRNEPVTVSYRRLLRERPELEAVRRPTGGRAVVHEGELTYSVVVPLRALGSLREAYRRINEGLMDGLRNLGVDAHCATGNGKPAAGGTGVAGPDAGPCFLASAEGEIVVDGCKLAGSAQARIGDALLQHGSVLLMADQRQLLGRANGDGAGAESPLWPRTAFVTLAEVLGEMPSWARMVEALARGLEGRLGGTWVRGSWTARELDAAGRLEARYRSAGWTWRRAQ